MAAAAAAFARIHPPSNSRFLLSNSCPGLSLRESQLIKGTYKVCMHESINIAELNFQEPQKIYSQREREKVCERGGERGKTREGKRHGESGGEDRKRERVKETVRKKGKVCTLSAESSQRRCKTPDGLICSGRGECDCGACICQVTEPGNYYGPRCECHDWVCATYDGKTCGGHGVCHCGKCECDEDWFGEACQYQEDCNLTNKKSKKLCRNPQGVVCSNAGSCHCGSCMCHNPDGRGLVTGRFCECDDSECLDEDTGEATASVTVATVTVRPVGMETNVNYSVTSARTCVCGECTCYDVDPSGDWGDIHGDTCECDERSCHATYDRYSDDFCSVPFPPSLCHSLPSFSIPPFPNPKSPHLLTHFLLPHLSTIFPFSSPTPSSLHSPSSPPGHGQCNCGRCDCKEGWAGKKCEHPLSCSLSLESSLKKCKGTSNMPCFGR
ncbi:unnamed protein product, partial [Coregonus sp. 'balchen']